MSSNTLTNRSTGQTILDSFFNDIHSAMDGDFVGRNASGTPTSGQNLGTLALPWGTLYCASLNLAGSALDTSNIVSPANRVVSGKKRTTSNQPAFITPNGAAASLLVAGATTNLVLSIGGASTTVTTDITKSSLTTAPSSQNTATVNDTTALAQAATRTWGEVGAPSKITVTSAGTNITNLVGKFASFKIVHSAVAEYFIALVESTTVLSHALRGYFYDSSLNPINAVVISNSDTITLMKTGFVYMTNDSATVDVSYTFPTYASSAPSSPATGDYWYDTVNQIWKRYDGAAFQIINRTLIGIAVMDSTNCVAARSMDFYAQPSSENTLDLEVAVTTTNIQAKRLLQSTVVNGQRINFGHYLPTWNGTNNYATSADYFSAFASSTTYYLYLTDQGQTMVSDIPPYYRPDLIGFYNRHNPWRCIAVATTDGSSNWSYVGTLMKEPQRAPTQTILNSTGTTTGYLFTITSGSATVGATYTNNAQTFTVLGTIASATQLFCSSTGAPAASGTLTKSAGTGDASITFSVAQATATYSPPPDVLYLRVRGVGGGGGGGGSGSGGPTTGTDGTITAFGASLCVANGGQAGQNAPNPGTGGTASVSSGATVVVAMTGNAGTAGATSGNASNPLGPSGAPGPWGGSGKGVSGTTTGGAAVANSGAGGAGGGITGSSTDGSCSGAAGGYFEAIITPSQVNFPPLAGYPYTIGGGGAGGSAGSSGAAGGAGGSGKIIIEEYYR